MNKQFDGLAKAIFDHDNTGPGCPAAEWDEQPDSHKNRYRTVAMISRLVVLGPIYRMEIPQPSSAG